MVRMKRNGPESKWANLPTLSPQDATESCKGSRSALRKTQKHKNAVKAWDASMPRKSLKQQAHRLGAEGNRGWLTPDGIFFESEETPAVRIVGLELGGHERAALDWLDANRPDLLDLLEQERIARGYDCWEDTDGKDVIKKFMFKNGFIRVSPD